MGASELLRQKKTDALRANRALQVGAFRDVRTEKAGVSTIRADQTETADTSMIYFENQVRGILGCV